MKLIALLGAGALAAGTVAAMPAEAQHYGYGHGYRGHGYGFGHRGGGYGYGHGGFRGHGYYGGGYGYRRHYGGYYGRPRVVCRLRPGYYGPVRRCFRAY